MSFVHTISPSGRPRAGLHLAVAPRPAVCPPALPVQPANDPGPGGLPVPVKPAANDTEPEREANGSSG